MSEIGRGKFAGQIALWNGNRILWFPDLFPAPSQPSPGAVLTWQNTPVWEIDQPVVNTGVVNLAGNTNKFWGADTTGPTTFILPPRTDPVFAIPRVIKDITGNADTHTINIVVGVITSGTTGTSDGTTTYTDPNATFSTAGVIAGDHLIVNTGPGAGTYNIVALLSQTQLQVSGTVAADAGPASYQIRDHGFEDGRTNALITAPFGALSLTYYGGYGWRKEGFFPSPWTSFTPVGTSTGFSLGDGTLQGKWRQTGLDTIEVVWFFQFGTTTNLGVGPVEFSLPSGWSIDTTKVMGSGTFGMNAFSVYFQDASTPANNLGGRVDIGATLPTNVSLTPFGGSGNMDATTPFVWATGDFVTFTATLPVVQV